MENNMETKTENGTRVPELVEARAEGGHLLVRYRTADGTEHSAELWADDLAGDGGYWAYVLDRLTDSASFEETHGEYISGNAESLATGWLERETAKRLLEESRVAKEKTDGNKIPDIRYVDMETSDTVSITYRREGEERDAHVILDLCDLAEAWLEREERRPHTMRATVRQAAGQ